jgi:hypothetical protein
MNTKFSEKILVVILFIAVLISFSRATIASKKLDKLYLTIHYSGKQQVVAKTAPSN